MPTHVVTSPAGRLSASDKAHGLPMTEVPWIRIGWDACQNLQTITVPRAWTVELAGRVSFWRAR